MQEASSNSFRIHHGNKKSIFMELLIEQMAKREGATEALKAADQMEWVRRMNNIGARAEEIVLSELVYR